MPTGHMLTKPKKKSQSIENSSAQKFLGPEEIGSSREAGFSVPKTLVSMCRNDLKHTPKRRRKKIHTPQTTESTIA